MLQNRQTEIADAALSEMDQGWRTLQAAHAAAATRYREAREAVTRRQREAEKFEAESEAKLRAARAAKEQAVSACRKKCAAERATTGKLLEELRTRKARVKDTLA